MGQYTLVEKIARTDVLGQAARRRAKENIDYNFYDLRLRRLGFWTIGAAVLLATAIAGYVFPSSLSLHETRIQLSQTPNHTLLPILRLRMKNMAYSCTNCPQAAMQVPPRTG